MKIRKSVKAAMEQLQIKKLRPNQLKPINRVLDGKDTLLIAATSFGKSLIAQIPAVVHHDKLTIIIEPLTALMHEQAERLQELGIPAAYLDSTQTSQEQKEVWEKLKRQELIILYLAPERLEMAYIPHEIYKNTVGLVVVDECHAVIAWGHTFREAYLHIGTFIDSLMPRPTVLAMTASAPPEDREEIMDLLSMKDAECITSSLYRSNLHFIKHPCTIRKEQQRALKRYLKKFHQNTTIIFCNTRKAAEAVACYLEGMKPYSEEVMVYHSRNKKCEREMLSGKKHIIVATSALAMGVSIPNVDLVIHFNMPMSVSDYYQMSGRAGREGQKARCILLYNSDDYNTNWGMLQEADDPAMLETALERLDAMKELCENTEHCIYSMMLEVLGEKHLKACRYCSNCQKAR